MARVKVTLFKTAPARSVSIDPEATRGATIGTNVYNADGTLFDPAAASAPASSTGQQGEDLTTDDVFEGAANLYFTDERAQDAVGAALVDTGDVPLAYDDATGAISASLSDVAITPGTYGDATHVAQVTFDAKGRATAVANVAISAAGSGGGMPVVTGEINAGQPVFVYLDDGSLLEAA